MWAFVEGLDLSAFDARIRAVEGHAGRPPIDPAILSSLWLYATLEGVGRARALDRLCDEHDAYRWICGGVGVNYHTLADFRVDHGERLEELLVQTVAALIAEGEVTLTGSPTTGSGSGRRRAPARTAARAGCAGARRGANPGASACGPSSTTTRPRPRRRQPAARERAARSARSGCGRRSRRCPSSRRPSAATAPTPSAARASTTDAEARVMRMGDGG